MSVEKLRAEIDSEVSKCDADHAEHVKLCKTCDRLLILRALLDEHGSLYAENAREDAYSDAEEAIQLYGESE